MNIRLFVGRVLMKPTFDLFGKLFDALFLYVLSDKNEKTKKLTHEWWGKCRRLGFYENRWASTRRNMRMIS